MTKNISQILGELDAEELELLLEGIHSTPLDHATSKRIRTAVTKKTALSVRRASPWRRLAGFAACVVLLFSIGFGAYAYAAEIKEYNKAVEFFNEHSLSTEGLSRDEIKAVYRDITTNSFSYSKTAEVIQKSLSTDQIGGYEIPQETPTPEDIRDLWNSFISPSTQQAGDGFHYQHRTESKWDDQLGHDVFDRCYFEKYDGADCLWSIQFTDFSIADYVLVSDSILVYGTTGYISAHQANDAWIAKISNTGDLIWKRQLTNGRDWAHIYAVVENPNGSYAIFSSVDFKQKYLEQYSSDGKQISITEISFIDGYIANAALFSDGYLLQISDYNQKNRIVKVDCLGNVTDAFTYEAEDSIYYITDVIEFDNQIYLSAYCVPKPSEEEVCGRGEINQILELLHNRDSIEISSEELTPLVRDNYTAMLLVCNPNGGIPQEFYSVKGSLGGRLALSDSGTLLWDVESIAATFYSPMTSSFSIGGTCYVFRYTFDESGNLMSQVKTGEVTNYRR
ncbi:MAG: hypothetical protein IJB11_02150 [Oscillospiraceae bacterium]|nr:hypothetical protein [Oscillospiraceae bacterium]